MTGGTIVFRPKRRMIGKGETSIVVLTEVALSEEERTSEDTWKALGLEGKPPTTAFRGVEFEIPLPDEDWPQKLRVYLRSVAETDLENAFDDIRQKLDLT